jgi:hypothetical protein
MNGFEKSTTTTTDGALPIAEYPQRASILHDINLNVNYNYNETNSSHLFLSPDHP